MEITESYYLETHDGLFFAVKGGVHPPDRIIAVVRYVPDPERGERRKNGLLYRRLYHFPEQEQLLRLSFPQYLAYDPVFRTTLQSVPVSSVCRVYDPCECVRKLSDDHWSEGVVEDALAFVGVLQKASGVPISAIGITGSLLIGLHRETSDLDLCVFGQENCRRVYQALKTLLNSGSARDLKRIDQPGIEKLYSQRIRDTYMDLEDFVRVETIKLCQGIYRSRPYFIRFIKNAHESGEHYGDFRFRVIGRAKIDAIIADDRDAIFTPCRYSLSKVQILDGPEIAVDEIVSFRGRFCEQARTGDSVSATGTLECVERISGDTRYRLLLGNFPEDTMSLKVKSS